MPENPASYRVVRTKSYLFNKAVKTLKQHPRKNKTAINIEYMKASIRARVEHPFRIIKRQFGFVKARYKGLLKNDNQLAMLFTLANLFRVDQMIRQWERSQ
ncbi:hypothetical protein AN685_0221160 [Enterobacter roggenkampii]|nr:hypothetical protein AN685_0221160 [Enterobacter roggenkampii]